MLAVSDDVRDALLAFYDRMSAKDVAAFGDLVEIGVGTLTIGISPGEWVTEEDRLRFGFETQGFGLRAGPDPIGYAEGTWVGRLTSHRSCSTTGRCGRPGSLR